MIKIPYDSFGAFLNYDYSAKQVEIVNDNLNVFGQGNTVNEAIQVYYDNLNMILQSYVDEHKKKIIKEKEEKHNE